MAYRIELTPAAARVLRKPATAVARRVAKKIESLFEDPRPVDSRKLEGEDGLYRVQAGDYRIVYVVCDEVLLVVVVRVGHRRDVYKAVRRR